MEQNPTTTLTIENAPETKRSRRRAEKLLAEQVQAGKLAVHEQRKPHEANLGHMIVTAEAQRKEKPAPQKRIATLGRGELLRMSDQIMVDGTSLHQIYESKLVGEQGLRRLIEVHQNGGDLKKALQHEILERELDFERDPAMRDLASHATGKPPTLQQLLKQANAMSSSDTEEVAFLKARAAYDAKTRHTEHKKRRLMDITLTAAVAILFCAVLFMTFDR